MELSFLNPFSDKFLQAPMEKRREQELNSVANSHGVGEGFYDWTSSFSSYGSFDGTASFSTNAIMFDTLFQTKKGRISYYRNMARYPTVSKYLQMVR